MITVKYKGEIVDLKDIEITWKEYGTRAGNDICVRTGDIEDYAQSKYSEGYVEGYDVGYDESVAWENNMMINNILLGL
jgi:hypothetical protein